MSRIAFSIPALALAVASCTQPPKQPPVNSAPACDGDVCTLSGNITSDLTLTADKKWRLVGGVFVGDDTDPTAAPTTLTIEPGTTIFGETSVLSFLLVTRGSRIVAEGTAASPIVFTSSKVAGERARGDWGGLVLNGQAPVNGCVGDPCVLQGEAGTGTYGGADENDDSGVLRFVRVEFSGALIDDENELNGVAFQGVGSGTVVDSIQVHRTADDCIEFFGGTVNAKHVVCTGAGDDNLDWTFGWKGKLQFLVAQQHGDAGERGIEADNNETKHDIEPISQPTISHITLIGQNAAAKDGIMLRRGTRAHISNAVVMGWAGDCVDFDDAATFNAAVDKGSLTGETTIERSLFQCEKLTGSDPTDPFSVEDMVMTLNADNAAVQVNLKSPFDVGAPGFAPAAQSPALTGGQAPSDAFFEAASFKGGLGPNDDWTAGWTAFPLN